MKRDEAEVTQSNNDPSPAADEVEEVLASLKSDLRKAVSGFWESLDQAVSKPIREAVDPVAQAHGLALAEAGLQEEGGGEDAPADPSAAADPSAVADPSAPADPGTWGRYAAYRNSVLAQLLEPLQDFLLSNNAAEDVEATCTSFRSDVSRLVASLPTEVRRPEPPELYSPREGDSLRIRMGKGLVRGRRSVSSVMRGVRAGLGRLVGQAPATPEPRAQVVPLRRLAEESLQGFLASRLEGMRRELHPECAAPLAALESAVTAWTRDWPLQEMELEAGGGYLPSELKTALSDALDRIRTEAAGPGADGQAASESGEDVGSEMAASEGRRPTALTVAQDLATGLAPAASFSFPEDYRERLETHLEEAWTELSDRVRVAGSFMGSSPSAAPVRKAEKKSRDRAKSAEAWIRWHRAVPNRLLLSIHLMRLREGIS